MAEIKEDIVDEQECSESENCSDEKSCEKGRDGGEASESTAEKEVENTEDGEKSEGEDKDEEIKEKSPEDQLQELNDKYMRLMAEYQNFRRRTDEEKANISTYANERIAKELLNVTDNFERALAHSGEEADSDGFRNGVELIYKQLNTILKNFGVEPMEAIGKPFDPNFHNAVMTGEAEGVEADIVIEEFQKGYMLRDRCLRPAMVKVSQ